MRPARPNRRQFVVGLIAFVPVGMLSAQTAAPKPAPKPAENSCVTTRVRQAVYNQFGVWATRKTRFKEDLGADSLDTVELTVELEHRFGIEIPDEKCARLHTVGSVIDYLSARLTPKQISNVCSGKIPPDQ